jgi:hypothetical protein
MTTLATPADFMSSTSAARGERSIMPRSLILTMTEWPLSRSNTLAKEANGSERCAAVAVTVSRVSPLAVLLPTRSYQAACRTESSQPQTQGRNNMVGMVYATLAISLTLQKVTASQSSNGASRRRSRRARRQTHGSDCRPRSVGQAVPQTTQRRPAPARCKPTSAD